jgi:outer membrane protein OmpA-like peptidoglycan-associated protein
MVRATSGLGGRQAGVAARFSGAIRRLGCSALCGLILCGCVQTQWQAGPYGATQTLRTADQTMDLETTDRVARVQRLAGVQGVAPPQIQDLVVPAGDVEDARRPIPVIRVTFDERDFFAEGSAAPRPRAAELLHVMAENMRRDVPDMRVTVLGHTDATGTEQANQALSQARALGVVQALVADGANPGQLSAIAIGSTQPVAPNATEAGRARNRRVEFLLSSSEQANLRLVSAQPVDPAFLAVGGGSSGRGEARPAPRSARRQVAVLRPSYSGPADFSEAPGAARSGAVSLASAGPSLTVGDDPSGSPVAAVGPVPAATAGVETGSPVGAVTAEFTP